MNKNTFYIIVIVGLLISNGILVFFLTQKENKKRPRNSPKEIVAKRLDFDDAQMSDYEVVIKKHQVESRQIFDQIQKSKGILYNLLSTTDDHKRDSLIQRITIKQGVLEQLNFNHFLEIKKICREDQTPEFEKLSHDFAKIFGKRRPPKK